MANIPSAFRPRQTCYVTEKAWFGWVSKHLASLWQRRSVDASAIDCFHLVCRERLTELCTGAATADENAPFEPLEKLVHFSSPSLAHFIALLCRPTPSSLPSDTALIVVDSFSALINHAFPKGPPPKTVVKGNNKGMVERTNATKRSANGSRPNTIFEANTSPPIHRWCPAKARRDS